jgi:hypothetical protein
MGGHARENKEGSAVRIGGEAHDRAAGIALVGLGNSAHDGKSMIILDEGAHVGRPIQFWSRLLVCLVGYNFGLEFGRKVVWRAVSKAADQGETFSNIKALKAYIQLAAS